MESSFTFPTLGTNEEVSQVKYTSTLRVLGRSSKLIATLNFAYLQNPLIAKATVSDSSGANATKAIVSQANDKVNSCLPERKIHSS